MATVSTSRDPRRVGPSSLIESQPDDKSVGYIGEFPQGNPFSDVPESVQENLPEQSPAEPQTSDASGRVASKNSRILEELPEREIPEDPRGEWHAAASRLYSVGDAKEQGIEVELDLTPCLPQVCRPNVESLIQCVIPKTAR